MCENWNALKDVLIQESIKKQFWSAVIFDGSLEEEIFVC